MHCLCQVIRIDPSKHCHAVKQLADNTDNERVKHIDELTWRLDDTSHQQASPAVDSVQSKTDRKLNDSSAKTKEKRKHLQQPTTKSNTSQRHAKTQHSELKLDGSLNETANGKNKQKISSKCDVEKLSYDKKLKHTVNFSDHDYKTRDSIQTKLQSSGVEEEMGVVSFTDEAEANDLSAAHRQSQQDSVYSEFESAVIDEYVDKVRSRNSSRVSSRQRTDYDSSDEDAFDLIASGRINTLIRRSPGSFSKHGSSKASESYRQRDVSSALTTARYEQKATKRRKENLEVEDCDSASSADTDVVLRSNRVMSHVMADLRNHSDGGSFCPNPDTLSAHQNGKRHLSTDRENITVSRNMTKDGLNTQWKQRRKRSAGGGSEADHSGVEEPVSSVDDSVVQTDSCRGDGHKRKQRSTKADQSDAGLKSCDKRRTVESVCNDSDRSNTRRHETEVSVQLLLCLPVTSPPRLRNSFFIEKFELL